MAKHSRVIFDAYIDDLTLSATADSEEEVLALLKAAAQDLAELIERELRCKVAREKSVVVSSSERLAQTLSTNLKCIGAVPAMSVVNLGVDHSCGKKRGAHRH